MAPNIAYPGQVKVHAAWSRLMRAWVHGTQRSIQRQQRATSIMRAAVRR